MNKNVISQVIDQEEIYQLLYEEDWKSLLGFIWNNSNLIQSDEIVKNAINICENTFFSNIDKEKTKDDFVNNLSTFHAFHKSEKYMVSNKNYKTVVLQLVILWKDKDLKQANIYAKEFSDDKICKEVIKEYKSTLPKIISHSQSENIQLTKNRNIANIDGRRPLFKSNQEREFFYAVRDSFPHFMVYPNVALSSVIDFESVKENLSQDERNYFFKAILDCVVFDDTDRFLLPIYFYELDSFYHDSESQKKKDKMKDDVLSLAGQELLRIRRIDGKVAKDDFVKIIKEATKGVRENGRNSN